MKQGTDLKQEWADFILNEDERAYYELYTHYYHYLSFLGFKKGASVVKVKDCINDLFLYLWENRKNLVHIAGHHNYLVTAFLRKLFREENFAEMYSLDPADLPEDHTAIPSVESSYILRNTRESISKILTAYVGQLPQKQRAIIYQKFYLGLSYKEISEVNGISVNTVYNTVYKAVEKLRLLISKEDLTMLSLTLTALSIFFLYFFINQ